MNRREFLHASAMVLTAGVSGWTSSAQRAAPASEFGYVDWSWHRWREITGESRPDLRTEQTGRADLAELLDRTVGPTEEAWHARRDELRKTLVRFVGVFDTRTDARLDPSVLGEVERDGYLQRKLTYQGERGERIPAYLLVPRGIRAPAPAVVCPHQTTQAGKAEPVGLTGHPEQHTAVRLVERGFVTLSYDALCFGDRHDPTTGHYGDAIPFYRTHRRWSLLGKMAWDLSRAIDYLETLDVVDRNRIGCLGHSHGGITTLFAMAFDSRIKAGASNCGFDTFRIDGNVWRWSHATALIPRLGFYVGSRHLNMGFYRGVPDSEVITVPFDLHYVLALCAPRALWLSTSDDDFVFPNAGWSARRALARVRPVYDLLGATDRLGDVFFSGGHRFPPAIAARAYDWMERWLGAPRVRDVDSSESRG